MQLVASFQESDRQPSKQRSSHLDAFFIIYEFAFCIIKHVYRRLCTKIIKKCPLLLTF